MRLSPEQIKYFLDYLFEDMCPSLEARTLDIGYDFDKQVLEYINSLDELNRRTFGYTLTEANGVTRVWNYKRHRASYESFMSTRESSEMIRVAREKVMEWNNTARVNIYNALIRKNTKATREMADMIWDEKLAAIVDKIGLNSAEIFKFRCYEIETELLSTRTTIERVKEIIVTFKLN